MPSSNAVKQRAMTLRDQTGLKFTEAKRAIETMSANRTPNAGQQPAVKARANACGLRLVAAQESRGPTPVYRPQYDTQWFFATDVVQAAVKRGDLPVLTATHDEEAAADRVLEAASPTPGVNRAEGATETICESVIAAFPQHLPGHVALIEGAAFPFRARASRPRSGWGCRLGGSFVKRARMLPRP